LDHEITPLATGFIEKTNHLERLCTTL